MKQLRILIKMLIIIQCGTPKNKIKITIQQCKLKIIKKSLSANNTKKKLYFQNTCNKSEE